MEISKIVFTIVLLLIVSVLMVLFAKILRSRQEHKKLLSLPCFLAIITSIIYLGFLMSEEYKISLIFEELYLISTLWLVMSMLFFTMKFSKQKTMTRCVNISFTVLGVIDSVSLLANSFFHHSFDLVKIVSAYEFSYWGIHLKKVHYIHLAFCYAIVFANVFVLVKMFVTSPRFYRRQFGTILVAYIVTVIANFFSYNFNFPIDFSVPLYPLLGSFLTYYTSFGFPKELLQKILATFCLSMDEAAIYYDIDGKCKWMNSQARNLFKTYEDAEQYRESWLSIPRDDISDQADSFFYGGVSHHFFVEYKDTTDIKDKNEGELPKIGSFLIFVDKTDEINQIQREQYEGSHDDLTGALNRFGFFKQVNEAISRNSTEAMILICSNIKNFKMINEIFGEKAGDSILKKIVAVVKVFISGGMIFGRINDDKFALYMPKANFKEDFFLEHLKSMQTVTLNTLYKIHFQFGIYEPRKRFENAQVMFDKALIAISSISNDLSRVFARYDSNLMDRLLEEKNILGEFDQAIENGQFKMYLQPQICVDGSFFGAEALVRWQHPTRGFIYPKAFISVLDKAGLLYKLDRYIWEQAAQQIRDWNERGLGDVHISVNVSAKAFYFIDIYKTFIGLVEKYKIDPSHLKIEITETVIMTDFKKAMLLFSKLQEYGFQIEIDDFGSGYSSLNMLKDIKADILKIDMVFLKKTENMRRSRIILESIISMAKSLDMIVLTEGVEEREQVEMLKELGCDTFQGYYFSKPLTPEEFESQYFTS